MSNSWTEKNKRAHERIKKVKKEGVFGKDGVTKGRTKKMIAYELLQELMKFVENFPEGRIIPLIRITDYISKPGLDNVPKFYRRYLGRNGIHLYLVPKSCLVRVFYRDPIKELEL